MQKKVGDLKKHADIVAAFKANVPAEFQGCVNDATGEITAPSKTPAYAPGTGQYANYLKSYIDAIWNKYKNEDLIFEDSRIHRIDIIVAVDENRRNI